MTPGSSSKYSLARLPSDLGIRMRATQTNKTEEPEDPCLNPRLYCGLQTRGILAWNSVGVRRARDARMGIRYG